MVINQFLPPILLFFCQMAVLLTRERPEGFQAATFGTFFRYTEHCCRMCSQMTVTLKATAIWLQRYNLRLPLHFTQTAPCFTVSLAAREFLPRFGRARAEKRRGFHPLCLGLWRGLQSRDEFCVRSPTRRGNLRRRNRTR